MNIFDNLAENYDKYRQARLIVANNIIDTINHGLEKNGRIIELGCGTGCYAELIGKTLKRDIFGVDISEAMLTIAKKKNYLTLAKNDCNNKLNYLNDNFCFAYSVNFIHFINNINNFFKEVYRILSYQGVAYTATHSEKDFKNQTLGYYFPDTIQLELSYAHSVEKIVEALTHVGFSNIIIENLSEKIHLSPLHLEAFRSKTYSSLHQISNKSFNEGIKKMESDIKIGVGYGVLSYTIIKGVKNE